MTPCKLSQGGGDLEGDCLGIGGSLGARLHEIEDARVQRGYFAAEFCLEGSRELLEAVHRRQCSQPLLVLMVEVFHLVWGVAFQRLGLDWRLEGVAEGGGRGVEVWVWVWQAQIEARDGEQASRPESGRVTR